MKHASRRRSGQTTLAGQALPSTIRSPKALRSRHPSAWSYRLKTKHVTWVESSRRFRHGSMRSCLFEASLAQGLAA